VTSKGLLCLQEGRKSLEADIQRVELEIEQVAAIVGRNCMALTALLQSRDSLRSQTEVVEQAINRMRMIADGRSDLDNGSADTLRTPRPGQYSGMKLSTAVQAYLSERDRGPIGCAKIVEDLVLGEFMVYPTRSKNGTKPRNPNTRDLRLLAANNTKRFAYDSVADALRMIPAPGNDLGWSPRTRKPRNGRQSTSQPATT
jgi:hypothetical protein